jgi:hypothetical protein
MQMNTKLKTLTKPIGTSHEKKKTMLTKTTTPLVLKLLAALCMLDCVGAQYETDRTAQNAINQSATNSLQKVRVLLPKHTRRNGRTAMELTGDAVLREVRPLARIPVVLLNVRSTLPTSSWTVHFVHGPRNTNAVTASPPLAAAITSGGLRLRRYTIGGREQDESLDRHMHFNYQKTPEFWRAFAAPMLLLFEPDTVMCPQPHVPLREFSRYAFVGAPWGAYASGMLPAWCNNLEHCVGNSGFSLWRRDVIAEALCTGTSSPCTLCTLPPLLCTLRLCVLRLCTLHPLLHGGSLCRPQRRRRK